MATSCKLAVAGKDDEIGNEAFELRLWDSRIGRWLSPDPYGQFSSPFLGMGNKPTTMIDKDGGYCEDAQGNKIPCKDVAFGDLFEGPTAETLVALDEVVVTLTDSKINEKLEDVSHLFKGHKYSGAVYNTLANQTDKLKPFAQIGRFDPKFQRDFLNRNISAQMGNVYSKDALRSISNLNKGLKFLGHTSVVAGYYTTAEAAYNRDYYKATVEGSVNTVGVAITYKLGIVPGLAWSGGWEGGKYFWNNTEVGQDIAWRYLRFHIPATASL